MRNLLSALSVAMLLAAAAPSMAAEKMDSEKLQAMAVSARTASEHATVAKHYRVAAESFEAQAAKHEAEANRLKTQPKLGLASKWPSMVPKTEEKERTLAMQARRAAQENLELADRHYRLSIDAQHAE